MYKMWEILERAHTGPFCENDDFTYKIFMPKVKEVVKKYDIKYDPSQPVPADDGLADRVWQAAVELFLDCGVLNVDTHRRMLVTESELKEALYHYPGRFLVGTGKDARLWESRKPEDTKTPFCIFSPDITYDEDLLLPSSIAYVQEPLADGVCGPILEESIGMKIKSGAAERDIGSAGARDDLAAGVPDGRPAGLVPGGGRDSAVGHRADSGEQRAMGRAADGRPVDRGADRVSHRQRAAEQDRPLHAV